MKKNIERIIFVFLGSFFMGAGIALSVSTGFGSDPLAMFWQGISNVFNISIGQSNLLMSIVLLFIPLLISQKELGIGTIVAPLVIGQTVDSILSLNLNYPNMIISIMVMLLGLAILALGAAIYIYADLGKSSYDATLCIINEKTGISVGKVRSLGDLLLFVASLTLKVNVNLAPFVAIIVVGPFIDVFLNIINNISRRRSQVNV
ncbi:MAG: hypothetical protein GX038_04290 [Erysipelothrix sp.]|nr:hypothetical protein [Erysipelothrix sp.]